MAVVSAKPKQPASADEIDPTDREDDRARPLSKSVIGHPLDYKRRKRRASYRLQDRRTGHPYRQVSHASERTAIEHAHDMAERLADRLGCVSSLAIERTFAETEME